MAKCRAAVAMLACVCALLLSAGVAPAAPIHDAAWKGKLDDVRRLLEADPGLVNLKDLLGRTPLHCAAAAGHTEVAELLIANGADVDATDEQWQTPLH